MRLMASLRVAALRTPGITPDFIAYG